MYIYRRTHSDTRKCNVHDTFNDHASTVAYYTCVAKRCISGEKERFPSRRMLKRCEKIKKSYLGEHCNTYIDAHDSDEETTGYKQLFVFLLASKLCINTHSHAS